LARTTSSKRREIGRMMMRRMRIVMILKQKLARMRTTMMAV